MCTQWVHRCARLCAAVIASIGTLMVGANDAKAEPQWSSALTMGGAGVGTEGRFWDGSAFHLGARGDVLFGREQGADAGYGPYLALGTLDFSRFEAGGGASVLAPVHDDLPLVFSLGGLLAVDDAGARPLVEASLFWGSRSYNYHSAYGMAAGLLVSVRQGVTAPHETSLLVAAQLDFVALSLPAVAFVNWVAGPTDSAK